MGRAPCCAKVGLKKGRWTAEEDRTLMKYINENGEGSWRSLPKNAGLLRCGKSCRLRWINYLRADLKRGNISKEEEELIVKLHATLGNRWSLIAGHLPGRTDNEIKNYWNSHLNRKIDGDGEAATTIEPGGKRRNGRSSRWTTKKTKEKRKENGVVEKEKHDSVVSPLNSNSVAHSDEGHSMVLDPEPTQASSVTIEGPDYEMVSGFLSPSIMDSGLLELRDDMEEKEAMLLNGSNQERDSGVTMSTSEEREGGAMVLNCSEGESGPMGLKEGREDGIVVGQSEIMGHVEGGFQVGQPLEWDLERLEAELLDGAGEMWSWHGEDHGYQEEESFASWFLSDAL